MDSFLSTGALAGILVGLLVLIVGLIILQVWSSLQIKRMSKTSYQEDVKLAQNQAANILTEAELEAKSILSEANEAGARATVRASQAAKETVENYQKELQNLIERYNTELDASVKRGDDTFNSLSQAAADSFNRRQDALNGQFDEVLASLSKVAGTLNSQTTSTMTELEQSIVDVTKNLEEMLRDGEATVKQQVANHLGSLLDQAEADVQEYKKARVTLLDSHIERLIEDIAVRVLHKKLSLDEHGELAQQALADAKEHNVL